MDHKFGMFCNLQDMKDADLNAMLSNDQQLFPLVIKSSVFADLEEQKEALQVESISLAEYIVGREFELMEAQKRLHRTHLALLEKRKAHDEMQKQRNRAHGSLDETLAILQASAAQCEEDSEKLALEFLEGFRPADEFLEGFIKKRTEAHIRRTKSEKLEELLESQRSRNG